MPRIHVELPKSFPFSTDIQVYIGHINHGQHVDNGRLLGLVSEARVRFFHSMGFTELNVEGLGIVVSDAAVQYKSEAFYGEILTFEMAANDFNKYGCDLVWRATDKDTGREVVRGKTGIVFLDYATRKVSRVPEGFLRKAGALPA